MFFFSPKLSLIEWEIIEFIVTGIIRWLWILSGFYLRTSIYYSCDEWNLKFLIFFDFVLTVTLPCYPFKLFEEKWSDFYYTKNCNYVTNFVVKYVGFMKIEQIPKKKKEVMWVEKFIDSFSFDLVFFSNLFKDIMLHRSRSPVSWYLFRVI